MHSCAFSILKHRLGGTYTQLLVIVLFILYYLLWIFFYCHWHTCFLEFFLLPVASVLPPPPPQILSILSQASVMSVLSPAAALLCFCVVFLCFFAYELLISLQFAY